MASNDKPKPKQHEIKSSAYHRSQTRKIPPLQRGQARVSTGREDRRLAGSQPDPSTPNITGRYQEKNGIVNFHVNQAGTHIECMLADVLTAKTQRSHKIIRFGGDLQNDGSFNLYAYPRVSNLLDLQGSIHVVGDNLLIKLKKALSESDTLRMVRKSIRPTLFEHALESASPTAKLFEWTPLVDQQKALLEIALEPKNLERKIRSFFLTDGLDVKSRIRRNRLVDSFDKFIGQIFSTEPPDGIHPQDLPLFQLHAQLFLHEKRMILADSSRSFLTWIKEMLTQAQPNTKGLISSHAPNVFRHLGLDHNPNPNHKFRALISAIDLTRKKSKDLGTLAGTLTIQRLTEPIWEQSYTVLFSSFSYGRSIGFKLGFTSAGSGESFEDWLPEHVPGDFVLLDAGISAAIGKGGSQGPSVMLIFGKAIHALPLFINLDELSEINGVTLSAEISGSYGDILEPSDIPPSDRFDEPLKITDYVAENNLTKQAHFHLGSAILTEEGRQALRIFCAAELASLSQRTSQLLITGYADRIDTRERNLTLSALRADNTYQAIKDILGNKLEIPQNRTLLLGLGESEAEAAGEADQTKNPKFRRVDIFLNHRVVVKLSGE